MMAEGKGMMEKVAPKYGSFKINLYLRASEKGIALLTIYY